MSPALVVVAGAALLPAALVFALVLVGLVTTDGDRRRYVTAMVTDLVRFARAGMALAAVAAGGQPMAALAAALIRGG